MRQLLCSMSFFLQTKDPVLERTFLGAGNISVNPIVDSPYELYLSPNSSSDYDLEITFPLNVPMPVFKITVLCIASKMSCAVENAIKKYDTTGYGFRGFYGPW